MWKATKFKSHFGPGIKRQATLYSKIPYSPTTGSCSSSPMAQSLSITRLFDHARSFDHRVPSIRSCSIMIVPVASWEHYMQISTVPLLDIKSHLAVLDRFLGQIPSILAIRDSKVTVFYNKPNEILIQSHLAIPDGHCSWISSGTTRYPEQRGIMKNSKRFGDYY